jgi:hypothetical protein
MRLLDCFGLDGLGRAKTQGVTQPPFVMPGLVPDDPFDDAGAANQGPSLRATSGEQSNPGRRMRLLDCFGLDGLGRAKTQGLTQPLFVMPGHDGKK